MKDTLVVNLFGSPSTGKSTTMAEVFGKLKRLGVDCEIATEFAKDLVWENRQDSLKDQLYVFAKQYHKLFRLDGKVQVVVTDSPLLLSMFYNNKYNNTGSDFNKSLNQMVMSAHNKFNTMNVYLHRTKPYNPNGRNQTEEESNEISLELMDLLRDLNVDVEELYADEKVSEVIVNMIMKFNK